MKQGNKKTLSNVQKQKASKRKFVARYVAVLPDEKIRVIMVPIANAIAKAMMVPIVNE